MFVWFNLRQNWPPMVSDLYQCSGMPTAFGRIPTALRQIFGLCSEGEHTPEVARSGG